MYLLAFAEAPLQLFPDGTLFIHIAMILLMIYILNRTFYRPINRILESRERNKGGHSSEADAILKEAAEKDVSYNRELLDARSKGYELIASEHKAAAEANAQKLAAAKAEIGAKFDAERAELERQKAEARANIGTEAEKMAEQITTNILGK
jgi:F-type H+-transporting ATPase subunit b